MLSYTCTHTYTRGTDYIHMCSLEGECATLCLLFATASLTCSTLGPVFQFPLNELNMYPIILWEKNMPPPHSS
uniref:Uncharacterized protein n=1 Tax=Anguilla anguilla TaxID=7936 RepID=A0A0E9SK69_ANGAN